MYNDIDSVDLKHTTFDIYHIKYMVTANYEVIIGRGEKYSIAAKHIKFHMLMYQISLLPETACVITLLVRIF